MKYLTTFVLSITVLLFASCSSTDNAESTATSEPDPIETQPALETAVPTDTPEPTEESYPVEEPTTAPIEAYPEGATTEAAANTPDPYPDQNDDGASESEIVSDTAYPSEINLSDVTSEPGDGQPQEAPQPGVPDASAAIVHQASQDLAARLGIDISEVTEVHTEAVEWPDSSLDCPADGFAYAAVVTPGLHITLEAAGQQYDYHTDLNGNIVLCGEDSHPVP
jgi:hypothetical protein